MYMSVLRYQLPIIFIVMNNNGIYAGLDDDTFKEISDGSDPMLRYNNYYVHTFYIGCYKILQCK